MTGMIDAFSPLADEATSLLKALSHPARLIICCKLRDGEMSVGDMETNLNIKQPRLSRELAKLRDEGLVETRRASKVIFYRLAEETRVRAMVEAICAVMLDRPEIIADAASTPATTTEIDEPKRRPNPAGGYGVFARTGE